MPYVLSKPRLVFVLGLALNLSPTSAQTVIYVDDDAPPKGDGTSWQDAYMYLQDALHAATAGHEVRVAGGLYKPDQDEAGNVTPTSRYATF